MIFLFGNLFDDALNAVGNVFSDAFDFARRLVRKAMDFLLSAIDQAKQWVSDSFGWITGAFESLRDFTYQLATEVTSGVGHVVGVGVDAVRGLIAGALNTAKQWVKDAEGLAQRAVDGVTSLAWTVWKDVRAYAEQLVTDLRRWAEDAIGAAGSALRALIGGVSSLLDHVWHDLLGPAVSTLWDFAFKWAKDLLHAVEAAYGWIVWLGQHTFSWWRDMFDDVVRTNPETVMELASRAVLSGGDVLEETLARMLS